MSFKAHTNFVRSVRFTESGRLVSSGEDGLIHVWETENYSKERTLKGHTSAILSLDVHKQFIISASSDCTVRLWNLSTGECIDTFSGHDGDVNTVVFVDDGMFAVSGSDDACLRLWNLANYLDTV